MVWRQRVRVNKEIGILWGAPTSQRDLEYLFLLRSFRNLPARRRAAPGLIRTTRNVTVAPWNGMDSLVTRERTMQCS
jgi:hypothetical protein